MNLHLRTHIHCTRCELSSQSSLASTIVSLLLVVVKRREKYPHSKIIIQMLFFYLRGQIYRLIAKRASPLVIAMRQTMNSIATKSKQYLRNHRWRLNFLKKSLNRSGFFLAVNNGCLYRSQIATKRKRSRIHMINIVFLPNQITKPAELNRIKYKMPHNMLIIISIQTY